MNDVYGNWNKRADTPCNIVVAGLGEGLGPAAMNRTSKHVFDCPVVDLSHIYGIEHPLIALDTGRSEIINLASFELIRKSLEKM